ncbi:MAG: ABC transporter permease [Alphaproteobacteria bacterium]|nr:ABC transporter permease [Alphaproteobacteria bacterium]
MTRFILRRTIQALLVLALMSAAVYGLIGLMPGDPIDEMISADPRMTSADAQRLKALYGLDKPLYEHYLVWAGRALQGDFGYSRIQAKPVLDVILPRLGNTIALMLSALLIALAFAVPLGVLAAVRAQGWTDRAINLACFAGVSLPTFWLALMLIVLFAVTLQWLPAGGIDAVAGGSLGERLRHLVLPIATLVIVIIPIYTRHVRAAMIEILGLDFVQTARAKGAPEARVVWRHALPNALVPVVTVLALELGGLFSGAMIIETIFGYPGMGKLIFDAIMGNDYNLALVALLFATAATLAGNLGADLAYARLDPRVRYDRT